MVRPSPGLLPQETASPRDETGRHADGVFVASGRTVPRTGGVILARGSRAEVLELVRQDPFHVHGVAEYTVTEFVPTMTSPELEGLRVQG